MIEKRCNQLTFIAFLLTTLAVFALLLAKAVGDTAFVRGFVERQVGNLERVSAIHEKLEKEIQNMEAEKVVQETHLEKLRMKAAEVRVDIKSTSEHLNSLEKDFQTLRGNYDREVMKRARAEAPPNHDIPLDLTRKEAPPPGAMVDQGGRNSVHVRGKGVVSVGDCFTDTKWGKKLNSGAVRVSFINSDREVILHYVGGGKQLISAGEMLERFRPASVSVCASYGI